MLANSHKSNLINQCITKSYFTILYVPNMLLQCKNNKSKYYKFGEKLDNLHKPKLLVEMNNSLIYIIILARKIKMIGRSINPTLEDP